MHSRQKLWLHGVVTRSLYGSRQMLHCPSECGRVPVGWGGVAWSVRELAGGCARTDGSGATSTGDAVSAAARSRAFSALRSISAMVSAGSGGAGRAFSARRSISAMVSAGSGGAAAGGATVGVVDSTSECWRSTRAAAALFSDMP